MSVRIAAINAALATLGGQHEGGRADVVALVDPGASGDQQITVPSYATDGGDVQRRPTLSVAGVQRVHPEELQQRLEQRYAVEVSPAIQQSCSEILCWVYPR